MQESHRRIVYRPGSKQPYRLLYCATDRRQHASASMVFKLNSRFCFLYYVFYYYVFSYYVSNDCGLILPVSILRSSIRRCSWNCHWRYTNCACHAGVGLYCFQSRRKRLARISGEQKDITPYVPAAPAQEQWAYRSDLPDNGLPGGVEEAGSPRELEGKPRFTMVSQPSPTGTPPQTGRR